MNGKECEAVAKRKCEKLSVVNMDSLASQPTCPIKPKKPSLHDLGKLNRHGRHKNDRGQLFPSFLTAARSDEVVFQAHTHTHHSIDADRCGDVELSCQQLLLYTGS